MKFLLKLWTDWFVLWVAVASLLAYFFPGVFTPLQPYIVPGLGVIMFGMGMTLVPQDFARVGQMLGAVGCGVGGQFLIMPLLAFGFGQVFGLEPEVAMGFIILGSCPGGTASNVIAYLARADVALSVTMTACSTLLAIVLTPLLVRVLGGQYLPVDALAMFLSVVRIVLIPVAAGLGVRYFMRDRVQRALEVFPAISVLVIVLIIATIIALSRDMLADVIGVIGVLVVAHNLFGMTLGYGFGWLFRLPAAARRTIAIEVGMQNSGLGVALATAHFASPLVALPSSLFSVVHNLTGSIAANYWNRKPADQRPESGPNS